MHPFSLPALSHPSHPIIRLESSQNLLINVVVDAGCWLLAQVHRHIVEGERVNCTTVMCNRDGFYYYYLCRSVDWGTEEDWAVIVTVCHKLHQTASLA